jgi:hypothetical protein
MYLMIALCHTGVIRAECPLDHWIIGCNPDGIWDTVDDNDLFVNSWQKYRDSGETPYANWHYPLNRAASFITTYPYRIGEPGFDGYQADNPYAQYTYDPNHAIPGEPEIDYSIEIRCLSISPGLRAVHKEYPQFTIADVNEGFSHSEIHWMRSDPHMHMSYQADSGDELRWITWQLSDVLDDGNPLHASDPFTLVFNQDPNAGDLLVDGVVDQYDLVLFTQQWLKSNAGLDNDYYERADANRDGCVDLLDFALLATHWAYSTQEMQRNN